METKRVLALGNTASVMSTIALALQNVTVASPPIFGLPVVDGVSRVVNEMAYPSSLPFLAFVERERRNYDIFHAELGYSLACLRASVPFGLHLHGVTDIQILFPGSAVGSLLKGPYGRALLEAEYVMCQEAVVERVRKLRDDAVVLESPVDTRRFNPSISPIRFTTGFTLFSPSRIDKWKGHEVTWAALSMMKNRGRVNVFQSNWGWEPEFSSLKKAAPQGVRFVDVIPRGEISHYYRGSDIVLGQMKIGSLGMAELEAAACGVPVTVYSADKSSPFLPKRSDARELADLLDRLIDDEDFRLRYARDCRNYVLENHSIDSVAARFSSIIRDASTSRGRYSFGVSDVAHLELGTGLNLIERLTMGRPVSKIRARLLGL